MMHKVAKHITEYELRLELVGKYFRRHFPSDTLIYFPAILLIQLKGLYQLQILECYVIFMRCEAVMAAGLSPY